MQPILLLHGAIGSSAQLEPIVAQLSSAYKVYTMNFSGHGGKPVQERPLSIPLFAEEVLQFLENEGLEKVSLFGYSMGGYVGMYLAKHHPDKINKLITLATKYEWNEAIAANEIKKLDPEKTEQKVPVFAESLRRQHAPADWKKLMVSTAEMMMGIGRKNPVSPEDYQGITIPVLLLLGDRDKMVTLDETVVVYKSLTDARLAVLPGTPHPVEQVDAETVAFLIMKFIQGLS